MGGRISRACAAAILLALPSAAGAAGERALREAAAVECAPGATDHTFLWWAHGWRGRSPEGRKVLCIQTGRYGLALDVEKVEVLHLGPILEPRPYVEAAAQDNGVVFSLPRKALEIEIIAGGARYRCVRGAVNQEDRLNFPVRIIESGRFFQRFDILQLEFEGPERRRLAAEARLEVAAWPDRVSFILEATLSKDLEDARIEMALRDSGSAARGAPEPGAGSTWKAGEKRTAWVAYSPGPPGEEAPAGVELKASDPKKGDAPVPVVRDPARGWLSVALPREDWREDEDLDRLERLNLHLSNRGDREETVRLLLAKDYPFPGVTGLTPMLRRADGEPAGIPVQISKNWHRTQGRTFIHEGPWLHGFTMLRLPPGSEARLELAVAYGRWGGVPAASHAQLCLVGWGTNQLWDQAAIGSWGESICYDPDVNLERSTIDDVRPLMVWAMNAERRKWTWTNNVGGGDFLVYFDGEGRKRFLTRMKTAYSSCGPNLTRVTYAGVSADGAIAARIEVSSPRSDDLNRAFHRFRYDVLRPAPFTRLAFYQVGSDGYNDHQFRKLARGNRKGLLEEWTFTPGGSRYDRTGIPCEGEAPWFSLHEAVSGDRKGGAWANRGLAIRSWKARLGEKDVPFPFASCYGTQNGPPSMNVEVSPPPGLRALEAGDFVEAEVELMVLPLSADDYYGPNEGLRAALKEGGNTWKPVHREAAGNHLRPEAIRGKILRDYPIAVEAAGGSAALEVTGGVGYVPVTFSGLDSPFGWELWRSLDGVAERIDQCVHGNDFWQADRDDVTGNYRLTYNVPFDSPGKEPRTVRLELKRRGR